MGRGQTYVVDKDITDRAEARLVCDALLDVIRPLLRRAHIDAVTDYPEEMGSEERAALATLVAKGKASSGRFGDPAMWIEVSVADPEWAALERFAPWAIRVVFYGSAFVELASFHDSGYSALAELTTDEASELARRVESVAPVILLAEKHARRGEPRGCLWPARGSTL